MRNIITEILQGIMKLPTNLLPPPHFREYLTLHHKRTHTTHFPSAFVYVRVFILNIDAEFSINDEKKISDLNENKLYTSKKEGIDETTGSAIKC